MIDWVTMTIRCRHFEEINDGHFTKTKRSGDVEYNSITRLAVTGSHDSRVMIRSAPWAGENMLEISGNLVKFMQGHNLWGTNDLTNLVFEFMGWLAMHYGPESELSLVSPVDDDVAAWLSGDYTLSRVDITESYSVGSSTSDVLAWLRAAESSAHLPYRGKGQLTKGSTLYFGKHSRRWSLKLYSKGQEILDNASEQPALFALPHAKAWASNILRTEMTIRSLELKHRGINTGTSWLPVDGVPFDPMPLLLGALGGMTMTTARALPDDIFDSLFPAQRTAYLAWKAGADLRQTMSKSAFYRLRSILLSHDIDISVVPDADAPSNVIPLVRVLEAVPASVPDWAHGTPLYFEPRKLCA